MQARSMQAYLTGITCDRLKLGSRVWYYCSTVHPVQPQQHLLFHTDARRARMLLGRHNARLQPTALRQRNLRDLSRPDWRYLLLDRRYLQSDRGSIGAIQQRDLGLDGL